MMANVTGTINAYACDVKHTTRLSEYLGRTYEISAKGAPLS